MDRARGFVRTLPCPQTLRVYHTNRCRVKCSPEKVSVVRIRLVPGRSRAVLARGDSARAFKANGRPLTGSALGGDRAECVEQCTDQQPRSRTSIDRPRHPPLLDDPGTPLFPCDLERCSFGLKAPRSDLTRPGSVDERVDTLGLIACLGLTAPWVYRLLSSERSSSRAAEERCMTYPTVLGTVLLLLFGAFEFSMRQGGVAKRWSPGDDDRGSSRLMFIVWVPAVAILFTTGLGPRLAPWTQWLGIAVGTAGILLRLVAFRTLGRYYTRTLVTVAGQGVVQHGPYRYIRHPGYLSALLTWPGAAAGLGYLLPPLLELLLLVPAYIYRIEVEEKMLLKNLGSEYATYSNKSWRLIPFVF